MRALISTSELLGEITSPSGPAQVHVSAEGAFDAARSLATVTLDCELRLAIEGTALPKPAWLPARQVVEEHMPAEEATSFAHDVFHHWVERVRRGIPIELVHLQ